ncbi:MAG TPA: M28 family peptidase, partial [Candidatus Eisenbacteria bacterium]|nr:M28 family peptidase [Candidatus Eisenbacteria bacterium]
HGRVTLRNVVAVSPGRSPQAIVVMAHRDNTGAGPGANDNASGTAALLEFARAYSRTGPGTARGVSPDHTIVLLSTDGGAYGALGAERFVSHSPYRGRVLAVVNLDAIAGHGQPRLELGGDGPRSPAAGLVSTAAERILEQTGHRPGRTSALGQLVDLALPFSLYEQAPFVGRGIPALTVTTAGDRPPLPVSDTPGALDAARLGQIGRAAEALVASLDRGLELAQGTGSYVYLGSRLVRGWAIELVLFAMLLPAAMAAVDLFARCRRRRIPLAPAFRSYRSRLGFWLLAGALFELFALAGAWGSGPARPLDPAGTRWPFWSLAGFLVLIALLWHVARSRLVPRRPATPEEQLAGTTAALVALGVVALVVTAWNPFALVFVLPSLHFWVWLPNYRHRHVAKRAALFAGGFLGPVLLLGSFALRFGLGLDAPWYLAKLTALGYIPLVSLVIVVAWAAVAAQVTALFAGRYAAYPPASLRPPRGPVRSSIRAVAVAIRRRRSQEARTAAEA